LQQTRAIDGRGASGEVEVFDYPACPGAPPLPVWDGWIEAQESGAANEPAQEGARNARAPNTAFDERLAEETRRSFEAGRERGREEGRQAEREAQAAALRAEEERRKRHLAGLIESFTRERDRFLHAVEQEVVKLALAVAARILRREAQMDPLLLTGAIRVALGQLAGASEVLLRVPAAEAGLWKETISLVPNLAIKPAVVVGDGMQLGECVIESKVGTVDLGVRSQLKEIERGFFDRTGFASTLREDASAEKGFAAQNETHDEVRT
jgi:flagellar assembly protein FliH